MPAPQLKTNLGGFSQTVLGARAGLKEIAREAMAEIVHESAKAYFDVSPHDTNRFRRAWAIANNEAGLPGLPVPPVVESGYVEQMRDRLTDQVRRVKGLVVKQRKSADFLDQRLKRWYDDKGRRPDKFYRAQWTIITEKRKHADRLERDVVQIAEEQLRLLTPTSILIGGRKIGKTGRYGKSQVARVRNTVYGGSGAITNEGTITKGTLKNLEPHAQIINKNHRVIEIGNRFVKGTKAATIWNTRMKKTWGKAG